MPRKVFVQPLVQNDDPLVFVIEGKQRVVDENGEAKELDWIEEFTAIPAVPAGIAADFVATFFTDTAGNQIWPADALMAYLEAVVIPEDLDRFRTFSHDKTKSVSASLLGDVVQWLAPLQSGHPSMPLST
jgi:hypothetical protein